MEWKSLRRHQLLKHILRKHLDRLHRDMPLTITCTLWLVYHQQVDGNLRKDLTPIRPPFPIPGDWASRGVSQQQCRGMFRTFRNDFGTMFLFFGCETPDSIGSKFAKYMQEVYMPGLRVDPAPLFSQKPVIGEIFGHHGSIPQCFARSVGYMLCDRSVFPFNNLRYICVCSILHSSLKGRWFSQSLEHPPVIPQFQLLHL